MLFAGGVLIFKDVGPLQRFCDRARDLIVAALGERPEQAQFELGPDEFTRRASDVGAAFRRSADLQRDFRDVLTHVGMNVDETYWDWLYLRIQPHNDVSKDGTLGLHRDTWSSNVYAQTNWWTPLFSIAAERTIAFYPAYWSRPVLNTSAEWDLDHVREMPPVPSISESIDLQSEVRIVIEPEDLLCFSGAHLHASVPNTSGATRFSVEVRTVTANDIRMARCAPNLDGSAPRTAWRWFKGITTGISLTAPGRPGT